MRAIFRLQACMFFILVCSAIVMTGCVNSKEQSFSHAVRELPAKRIESYQFDKQTPLMSRIVEAPIFLINYLEDMDRVDTYVPYLPSESEMAMIDAYLQLLPPLNLQTIQEKLIGIYFVENFMGSGMADYVLDAEDNVHVVLIINPETLWTDLSEWMTYRENTCFTDDNSTLSITVECDEAYLGLLYVLLHETTHAVDYVHQITPFVDKDMERLWDGDVPETTEFVRGVWEGYSLPEKTFQNEHLNDVTFYGFNDGPKLSKSSASQLYEFLVQTPFVSLYGTMNWAEDLAEYATWYHVTQHLGIPYRIEIHKENELVATYAPMDFDLVEERTYSIQFLY